MLRVGPRGTGSEIVRSIQLGPSRVRFIGNANTDEPLEYVYYQ
jgi:hypothetical protein